MEDSKELPKLVPLNIFDLAIDAILFSRDYELVITFFSLPKHIRSLIRQSFFDNNVEWKDAWQFGVLAPAIHWTYNEEPMTEIEIEVENYLKFLSRPTDLGCLIFINKKALLENNSFLESIK